MNQQELIREYSDILHDWLLLSEFGHNDPLLLEFQQILNTAGVDTDRMNYRYYTTLRGIFTHFEHIPTGVHI